MTTENLIKKQDLKKNPSFAIIKLGNNRRFTAAPGSCDPGVAVASPLSGTLYAEILNRSIMAISPRRRLREDSQGTDVIEDSKQDRTDRRRAFILSVCLSISMIFLFILHRDVKPKLRGPANFTSEYTHIIDVPKFDTQSRPPDASSVKSGQLRLQVIFNVLHNPEQTLRATAHRIYKSNKSNIF